MNKSFLIIKREYLTRIRKRSFVIMTLLGPLLLAGVVLLPLWLKKIDAQEVKNIAVLDQTTRFRGTIPDSKYLKFHYINPDSTNIIQLKEQFHEQGFYGLLFIPRNLDRIKGAVTLFSHHHVPMGVSMHIAKAMEKQMEQDILEAYGVNPALVRDAKVPVMTIKMDSQGQEEYSNSGLRMGIGIIGGVLIYFFVFMYGAQVLRSVIEEKTSRIVELIVSSVKPVQLMLGKIVGVALVGLTQFLLWMALSLLLISLGKAVIFPEQTIDELIETEQYEEGSSSSLIKDQPIVNEQDGIRELFDSLELVNFGLIIGAFLFYFLLGYLLYSSLFAAIGAAVDNDTDTQQFMLPLTIPLILSFVMIQVIINNPDGAISFWFSVIPLTSPVVMMVRIPYGVPIYEAALSAGLLLLSVAFAIWMAAKIYRTGILMYGKKVSYRELWKWLRYRN